MTADRAASDPPLIDLERLVAGIRWRRRMWLSFALLGMLGGILLAMLVPPAPTAVTTVLVVHENDSPSDAGTLVATDVALLQTSTIAETAARELGTREPLASFRKSYEGLALTNNLLELTAYGTSEADAVARARAVAEAFIDNHIERTENAAKAEAQSLLDRRDQATEELAKVDSAIARATGGDDESVAGVDSLYSQRSALTAQIQQLGQEAEAVGAGAPRVAAGSRIIDQPHALKSSALLTGGMYAAGGLALGLIAGLGLAAVASVVRNRPVLRRDIAEELGASVIAQLPARPRGPFRRSYIRTRKRVAATLARIIREGPGTVSLLELGAPAAAAGLAMTTAATLAPEPVVIVDNLTGNQLRTAPRPDGPIQLLDAASNPPRTAPGAHRVGVGSAAPGVAWPDLPWLGAETVLIVRAGHADGVWLHTVARQLAAARIPIIGVVLVHPDPRDRSDGTLWDGLRTALRGRAAPSSPSSNGGVAHRPAGEPSRPGV